MLAAIAKILAGSRASATRHNKQLVRQISECLREGRKLDGETYHLTAPAKAGPLYTVFSHVNTAKGKFAQYRQIHHLGADCLFLNPGSNDWYQQGVPGLAEGIDGLVSAFTELSQATGRQICFVGHSMGGYAALILSSLVPSSTHLATSPELALGLPFTRSTANEVVPVHQWRDLYERLQHETTGQLLFGVFDAVDACFLGDERSYDGRFGSVGEVYYHHGITELMARNHLYSRVLARAPQGECQISLERDLHAPGRFGSQEQYSAFYETHCAFLAGRQDEAMELVRAYAAWSNPGWCNLRSKILEKASLSDEAYEAARIAATTAGHVYQFVAHFGDRAIKRGDRDAVAKTLYLYERYRLRETGFQAYLDRARRFMARGR